eukprot:UN03471
MMDNTTTSSKDGFFTKSLLFNVTNTFDYSFEKVPTAEQYIVPVGSISYISVYIAIDTNQEEAQLQRSYL